MHVNPTNLTIAALMAALISYGIAQLALPQQALLIGVGSFIALFSTLGVILGLSAQNPRAAANARVAAMIFFALLLAEQLLFASLGFSTTAYVIVTGLCFLAFVLLANALFSTRQ